MRAPTLTEAQFDAALAHTSTMARPAMYRLMLLLSIRLGLRPMELAGLQSTWVRHDELRIPLGHSKRKEGRSLPLSDELLAAFAAHLQGRAGTLFLNEHNAPFKPNGISDAIRRLYRMAGMQASCYSGRRTAAQKLLEKDANILVIQAFLGHKSPLTTLEYVGVSQNHLRKALFA